MTDLITHKNILTVLMDEADFCAVMACDGQWQQVAPQVTRLLATSSFAYTMFSVVDEMQSSNSYAADIESLLDELYESQVTEDTAAKFRSQAADRAFKYKKEFVPTKREIEVNLMGLNLTDVVQDLNAEWELRFLSRLLATALNQKDTLERLPCEEWVFLAPTADASNIGCSLLREDDRSTQSRA